MKNLFSFFVFMLMSFCALTQPPQKMSYQAIIRNSNGALITNQNMDMRISILQGSSGGISVYVETQTTNTNSNGLVTLQIGMGTKIKGTMDSINWGNGPYFVKTETDPDGGVDYTITGTSELLSVPYALYTLKNPEKHFIGESFGGGIVFYVYDNGLHGLIAATANQTSEVYCKPDSIPFTTNGTRDGIGAGKFNTERIIASQMLAVVVYQLTYPHQAAPSPNNTAANVCANYQGGGFGDWYLPSKYELNLMYLNKQVVPGMLYEFYWSSTEYSHQYAWVQGFYAGVQEKHDKSMNKYIRAIRAF
ncbi:MAG: DUF1566 domain-containing protein [Bacteroidia bacterium]